MKKIFYGIATLVCFILGLNNATAQAERILERLDIAEAGGKVHITVTIKPGFSCFGMNIMRSEDSLLFAQVGKIEGICGSPYDAITYSFTDENPIVNKTSYYKLQLGGHGYTETFSIRVVDTQNFGFLVIPNPVKEQTTVYFKNPLLQQHNISIFNQFGFILLQTTTVEQFFDLNLSEIDSGAYFFVIMDESGQKKAVGRIVKI